MTAPLTDAACVAELREKGLGGPITSEFLASYRQDREFMDAVARVDALPGGLDKYRRALVRAGLMPPTDRGDEQLLAAWAEFLAQARAYEAAGPDSTDEIDAPITAAQDAMDEVLIEKPATTLDGAIVKLRRALIFSDPREWCVQAALSGDDTTLFARAEEFDRNERLLIDALAALVLVKGRAS